MAEQKIKPTKVSVASFLKKVADPQQRADSMTILKLMKDATGLEPTMWGPSMIGFGTYHYKYASGHEGDCFLMGFSPRKGQMSLYFMPGLHRFQDYLKKLGKYTTGKSCLYIKKLADVDVNVLNEMIEVGFTKMCDTVQVKQREAAQKKAAKRKAR